MAIKTKRERLALSVMPNKRGRRVFADPERFSSSHHCYLHVPATGLYDLEQRLQSQLDRATFRCDLVLGVVLLEELTNGLGTATNSICLAAKTHIYIV